MVATGGTSTTSAADQFTYTAVVNSVNSSTANGSYKAGQSVSIQVNFSSAVTVTGTPQAGAQLRGYRQTTPAALAPRP